MYEDLCFVSVQSCTCFIGFIWELKKSHASKILILDAGHILEHREPARLGQLRNFIIHWWIFLPDHDLNKKIS